jgi:hypothetical protein
MASGVAQIPLGSCVEIELVLLSVFAGISCEMAPVLKECLFSKVAEVKGSFAY